MMSNNEKIKNVLLAAADVAHCRQGDLTTDDGTYATTDVDAMLYLIQAITEAFDTGDDDVIFHKVKPIIEKL